MTRDELLDLFRRSGALLDGHFRLSSGLHSTGLSTVRAGVVVSGARRSAGSCHCRRGARLESVRGALAGAGWRRHRPRSRAGPGRARAVRRAAGRRAHTAARLQLSPQPDRVVVIEDVVTTGESTLETMQVARGGRRRMSSASGSIVESQRWPRATSACRTSRCFDMTLPTYEPGACPLCAQGYPWSSRGHAQLLRVCTRP